MEAFNAGDVDKYKDFLRKNFPARLERADRQMELRQMTGGFDLRKVEESTPTKLVALIQEHVSDQFVRLTVEVDTSEPHQMTRLDLQGISRPAEFALPHLKETELLTVLQKKLDEWVAAVVVGNTATTVFFSSAY